MKTLDIKTEYQPWSGEWIAIDANTYDGAPDSVHTEIGRGETEAQAIHERYGGTMKRCCACPIKREHLPGCHELYQLKQLEKLLGLQHKQDVDNALTVTYYHMLFRMMPVMRLLS